jgi:DNA-directed RNA polymerase specialized sigma subunit
MASAGLENNALYRYPARLPELDHCVETIIDWIYENQSTRADYKLLRFQDKRNREIVKRFQSGETMTAIATDYGITVQRVSRIIKDTINSDG